MCCSQALCSCQAIIRDLTETVLGLNFPKTGDVVLAESCESGVLHLLRVPGVNSTSSSHGLVSGTESGEAGPRRRLVSRAGGGYAMTSDDPTLGSLTVFQYLRLARPQDASKALELVS